jgi:hypothetical protein
VWNVIRIEKGKHRTREEDINNMAAVSWLALALFLCISDIILADSVELKVSTNVKVRDIVGKCGCSRYDCLISSSLNSPNVFEISNVGNIVLDKDAMFSIGETHSVSIVTKNNCYDNMPIEQKYVFHVVESPYSVSMSSSLLHSSIMLGFPALVGSVSGLLPSLRDNDQRVSFRLLGPLSKHFKVDVNSADDVYISKEQTFIAKKSSQTFLFILEVKGEYHIQYHNVELYVGDELEDLGGGDSLLKPQQEESHVVVKRQSTISKEVSVYENTTEVLFNVLSNQASNSGFSFEITGAQPENIFQIDSEGNVTLTEGSALDYDRGHKAYRINIIVRGSVGAQGIGNSMDKVIHIKFAHLYLFSKCM